MIGELEVARNHLRVRQPVRRFRQISVGVAFLGSYNQLGGYCLRFAHVGTELLHEKYLEQCRPGLSPADAGPLAKLHGARRRLLGFERPVTLAVAQRGAGCVPEIQFQLCATVVVGKLLQLCKSGLIVRERFAIGTELREPPDRAQAIFHRLGRVAAARIVMRQFGNVIVKALGIGGFQRGADPLMQYAAAIVQHRLVGDVMSQRVLEDVLDVAGRGLLVDKLGELELRQHLLQCLARYFTPARGRIASA